MSAVHMDMLVTSKVLLCSEKLNNRASEPMRDYLLCAISGVMVLSVRLPYARGL
jgi:hypothetical protein